MSTPSPTPRPKQGRLVMAIAGAILLVLILVPLAIGLMQPRTYTISDSRQLPAAREAVWARLSDHGTAPEWRSYLKRVERQPELNGHEVWKEVYTQGPPVTLETTESVPPSLLVWTIVDQGGPFTGYWRFELVEEGAGTKVTMTEYGDVPNPFFRFLLAVIIGREANLKLVLNDIARQFPPTS